MKYRRQQAGKPAVCAGRVTHWGDLDRALGPPPPAPAGAGSQSWGERAAVTHPRPHTCPLREGDLKCDREVRTFHPAGGGTLSSPPPRVLHGVPRHHPKPPLSLSPLPAPSSASSLQPRSCRRRAARGQSCRGLSGCSPASAAPRLLSIGRAALARGLSARLFQP